MVSVMKELFRLLADYNAQTNAEMLGILEQRLPAEQAAKDLGSYFGSILGILNHLLISDVLWLRRFSEPFPELASLRPQLPGFKLQSVRDVLWPGLADFQPVRSGVDGTIRRLFEILPEERYGSTLRYRNIKGVEQQKTAWRAFLHFFNHQTHHRGQVSVLLDQLSVENDYSNLIGKF